MATHSLLEDEISCSICLEVYRDPHVLKECLHTFCLPCIHLLDKDGKIECPQCREFSNVENVKKDFKTQSVIDKLQKHDKPVEISTESCGMCQNPEKPIKYKCAECDHFMCAECSVAHGNMKVCKSHTVTAVREMIQGFQKNLEVGIKELETEFIDFDKKSEKITQKMEQVNISMTVQLQQVERFTQDAMKSLKANESRLKKLIQDTNISLLRNFKEKQRLFTNSKKEIREKITSLNEMIQSQDFKSLKEAAENINENIKENIKEIKASLPEVDEMKQSPVTVKRNDSLDVRDCIQVMVDDDFKCIESIVSESNENQESNRIELAQEMKPEDSDSEMTTASQQHSNDTFGQGVRPKNNGSKKSTSSQRVQVLRPRNGESKLSAFFDDLFSCYVDDDAIPVYRPWPLYSCLYKKKWVQKHSMDTGHSCNKLCRVNNDLWCGGEGMITVYNKQFQQVKRIEHDKLKDILSLVQYDSDQVIVASRDGLHSVTTYGHYLRRVMPGNFSDVAVQVHYLFALDYENNRVVVITYTGNYWIIDREIQVKYDHGHHYDRLCVTLTNFCISSWVNKHIYTYNVEGRLKRKLANGKTVLLCDADEEGSWLVTDIDNNNMCVVHKKSYHSLSLNGEELEKPFHAFLTNSGNLYVVTGVFFKGGAPCCKLFKYSLEG